MGAAYLKAPDVRAPLVQGDPRCIGKVKFASATLAYAVARRRSQRKEGDHAGERPGQEPYRCDACGAWHLGTIVNNSLRVR